MNTYQGIVLTDDQMNVARARLRMRVQQAVIDMHSSSYDPGTIAYLIADLEALSRFDSNIQQNGVASDDDVRPAKAARRGH